MGRLEFLNFYKQFYRISVIGLEKPEITKCTLQEVISAFRQELRLGALGRCGAVVTDSLSLMGTSGEGESEERWWFEAYTEVPTCGLVHQHLVQHNEECFQVADYSLELSEISLLRRFRRLTKGPARVSSILVLPEMVAADFVSCLDEKNESALKTRQLEFLKGLFEALAANTYSQCHDEELAECSLGKIH